MQFVVINTIVNLMYLSINKTGICIIYSSFHIFCFCHFQFCHLNTICHNCLKFYNQYKRYFVNMYLDYTLRKFLKRKSQYRLKPWWICWPQQKCLCYNDIWVDRNELYESEDELCILSWRWELDILLWKWISRFSFIIFIDINFKNRKLSIIHL